MRFFKLRHLPLLALAPCAALAVSQAPSVAQPAQVQQAAEPFTVEIDQFETEPVNPFNAENGSDTCMTVTTIARGAENVQWFTNRRLTATKDGRARVLWDENNAKRPSKVFEGKQSTMSTGYQSDNFLFQLRGVPADAGEITFEWEALAQPSKEEVAWGDDKLVSLAEMDEAAKKGGVRLSRKLVLRKEGAAIEKPTFAAKPPVRVLDVKIEPLEKPNEHGNDTRIVLRMAYEGAEAEPEITAPEGLELRDADKLRKDDDENERIPRSFQDTATREADTQNYRLEAGLKKADLENVRFLSIEANVSDGKSWPMRLKAGIDLQHAPK